MAAGCNHRDRRVAITDLYRSVASIEKHQPDGLVTLKLEPAGLWPKMRPVRARAFFLFSKSPSPTFRQGNTQSASRYGVAGTLAREKHRHKRKHFVNVHDISMGQPLNPYRRGMISAVVLLIPTSSD